MTEGSFEGVGGLRIFTRAWRPAGRPVAVVVIVHGFNSHSGQYDWVAEHFVSNGLAVYALDHRGRGKSAGERFFVETFDDYVADLAKFVTIVKTREPDLPVFMLGHSAGGVIACLYALEHQGELAGLISESFAYEAPAPDFALTILKGLSRFAPHARALKLKNADFSRDPEVVAAMNEDPLIANEVQPAKTIAELVRADERLKREAQRITLPILLIHGTGDKATRPSGSRHFYALARSNDKMLKLYEGYYHNLLADLGKQVVMADVQAWIDDHLAATPIQRTSDELRA
ncbi:MAG TPA: lysophospholipase [Polyangia bacterium]|jgi:alpha-beta hydrolase superfamily lysophospholipase|nr:lysophospholipase [Polyangia bacterium]